MAANTTSTAILNAIEARDPDGGHVQPREYDYIRHRDWAVREYGVAAWIDYVAGGWNDPMPY